MDDDHKLLDALLSVAKKLGHGRVVVELTIRQGQLTSWEITEERKRMTVENVRNQ